MFAERGRYALTLRGSGSRGTKQQKLPLQVAGDIVVVPDTTGEDAWGSDEPVIPAAAGIQIEVGGSGKRFDAEFAELRDAAIPGYALALCIFTGMKPKRWLLADDDGGHTECADLDDLLATIEGRF